MRIEILNPSSRSDTGITEDMAFSLSWLAGPGLPSLSCLTLADGPNGISTARDSDEAAPAILRHIGRAAKDEDVAGFVVACFSDPGVYAARGLTRKPVVGIGEAGFAAAAALGDRFGTISVSGGPGGKLLRQLRLVGLSERHAGHRGLSLDYGDLKNPEKVEKALIDAGLQLRDEYAAQAIVLAGAGFARYIAAVEDATGLVVVDPTQSAVSIVLTSIMQSAACRPTK
ncbi:aspartate/glutamate racemase family protein [Martelella sp. AMO21009]